MSISGFPFTVERFLSQGLYAPADVQREYKWESVHVTQFLDDIIRAADVDDADAGETILLDEGTAGDSADDTAAATPTSEVLPRAARKPAVAYVLGTLVTHMSPGQHRWHIYDGLQRLTTMTLLLQALIDRMPLKPTKASQKALRNKLRNCLKNPRGTARLTAPGWGEWINTSKLLDSDLLEESSDDQADVVAALSNAAQLIDSRLSQLDGAGRSALAAYVMDKTHFVILDVTDKALARQIFVTTNNRGKTLNTAEIFKGQLAEIAGTGKIGRAVLKRWDEIRNETKDVLGLVGTLAFIECGSTDPDQAALQLTDALREHIAGKEDALQLLSLHTWMETTARRAKAWTMIESNRSAPGDASHERAIFKLGLLEDLEWRGLAVELVRRYLERVEADPAQEVLAARTLTQQLEAVGRRLMALKLADAGERARHLSLSAVMDAMRAGDKRPLESFRIHAGHLSRIHRVLTFGPPVSGPIRVLLKWLEAERAGANGDLGHLVEAGRGEEWRLSPEHILPKNPRANSVWAKAFPDRRQRNDMKQWPANFVLLPHGVNEKLGRGGFNDKAAILASDPAAAPFSLVQDVLEYDDWTPGALKDRAASLTKEIYKRLSLKPPTS